MAVACQYKCNECRPRATNAIGVEVQEFVPEGWTGITEPYETFCEARMIMRGMPESTVERRVYTAFAVKSNNG